MYIQKEIMTNYGIPASYHVLQEIHTYYNDGIAHVNIAGYFHKEAYANGSNAVVVNQVEVNQTAFDSEKDIYAAVLNSIVFRDGVLFDDNGTEIILNTDIEGQTDTANETDSTTQN